MCVPDVAQLDWTVKRLRWGLPASRSKASTRNIVVEELGGGQGLISTPSLHLRDSLSPDGLRHGKGKGHPPTHTLSRKAWGRSARAAV